MKITFKKLPYPENALEPLYSARTVHLHYDKHHRTYFDKTVAAIKGTKFEDMTLEEIVTATAQDRKQTKLYNNAAQVWNHDLFWESMKPKGGGRPNGALAKLIERDFGGIDGLRKALKDSAVDQFGSGWAWLCYEDGKLHVSATSNADNPLGNGGTALLAFDVWEHAYYLDYQYRRPDYVDAFLDHLVNWDTAAKRLEAAGGATAEESPRRRARA